MPNINQNNEQEENTSELSGELAVRLNALAASGEMTRFETCCPAGCFLHDTALEIDMRNGTKIENLKNPLSTTTALILNGQVFVRVTNNNTQGFFAPNQALVFFKKHTLNDQGRPVMPGETITAEEFNTQYNALPEAVRLTLEARERLIPRVAPQAAPQIRFVELTPELARDLEARGECRIQ